MLVVDKIYEFARETPERPAVIAELEPITYAVFATWIGAMRRRFAGLRKGGVALLVIDDLPRAWVVDLALRSLGHTTVSVRTILDLEGLAGLDLVALVTLAAERQAPFEAEFALSAARVALEADDFEAVAGAEP